jgi:LemA protein
MAERLSAEGEIGQGVGRLLAVWEQYPALKADQHALKLQEELVTTENRIAYSRGYYNDISANFNALILQFPSNLMAGALGFRPRVFFAAGAEERSVPSAKFQ